MQMWYEKENVNKKGQERHQERWQEENQQCKQVSCRVGRRMEVCRSCQPHTDKVEECCDRVNNEERGEGVAGTGWEAEVGILIIFAEQPI